MLYTDGVTEARAPKRVWGSNDLARFVGAHEPLRAAAIAERIERGALSAQADEPRDDVAIVVLKVTAAGMPAPPVPRSRGRSARSDRRPAAAVGIRRRAAPVLGMPA